MLKFRGLLFRFGGGGFDRDFDFPRAGHFPPIKNRNYRPGHGANNNKKNTRNYRRRVERR